MMKRSLVLSILFFLFFQFSSKAQESMLGEVNYPLLEKYITLAKEYYPRKKVFEASIIAAKSRISTASMGYLEALNVSYIYRPENGLSVNLDNPYSVNGFQFGVNLNIGTFLKTPSLVKQSKQDYKIAILQDKEYSITLAEEVRNRYYEYLQLTHDLKLKTLTYADNQATSNSLKYKFEKGEITLDVYSNAKVLAANSNSEKLLTELNLLKAKSAIEALIGQRLEDVK